MRVEEKVHGRGIHREDLWRVVAILSNPGLPAKVFGYGKHKMQTSFFKWGVQLACPKATYGDVG